MLRDQLNDSLRGALKARASRDVATLRLILAALKDRDIAARGRGNTDGIDDTEIEQMLRTMIKQRRESISLYEQGGRLELAEQEQEEIDIISRFLPQPMSDAEIEKAVGAALAALGTSCMKDMGKVMTHLRETHGGSIDLKKANAIVRAHLN